MRERERQTTGKRMSEADFRFYSHYVNSLMISRGIRGMESDKMKINDAELNIADEFKGEIPQH
jgi:hypothetical protein